MVGFFELIAQGIKVVLDGAFGWAILISPYFGLFLVTVVLTFLSTLVYKYTSDQTRLKEIKEEMNGLKKKLKESSGDMSKMSEHNKKMTDLSMETMKYSLFNWKYMLLTLVPLGLVFSWLKSTFIPLDLWGGQWGWLIIYLGYSIFVSTFVRKVLKVY